MQRQIVTAGVSALLLFAACGSESAGPELGTESSNFAPETSVELAERHSSGGTDQSSDATTRDAVDASSADESASADSEFVARALLSGGELTVDSRRVEVPRGDTVVIEVLSDEVEHVHVHGYDLIVDVGPDKPGRLSFIADSAGTFEVELEVSGRSLFDLLVR